MKSHLSILELLLHIINKHVEINVEQIPAFTVIENFKCFKHYILEPKYAKTMENRLTFTKNFIIKMI